MHLVASKPLKLVGVERLAERLLADQRAVGQLLLPVLEPRQHLAFEEAAQALDIGGGRLFAISMPRASRYRRSPIRNIIAVTPFRGVGFGAAWEAPP
jgi:hypothetical protein